MRIIALLSLGLFYPGVHAAEISNFMSGAVCFDAEGEGSVCEQAEDIQVTGESTCKWSGKEKPCTWFGFEFDYENADPEVPLECAYERSVPSSEGNYEGVRQTNVTTGNSIFDLSGSSGHFYNPMFQLYSQLPEGQTAEIVTYMDCSIGDAKTFEMTFRLHIGAAPPRE